MRHDVIGAQGATTDLDAHHRQLIAEGIGNSSVEAPHVNVEGSDDTQRAVQLPADYIERGRLCAHRHQNQYRGHHNFRDNNPFPGATLTSVQPRTAVSERALRAQATRHPESSGAGVGGFEPRDDGPLG